VTRPNVSTDEPGRLLVFVMTAALVGAGTGAMAGSFRLMLSAADDLRRDLTMRSHGTWWGLPVLVLGCAAATALAAALVHRVEPHAEGSGIPRVEGVVEGRTEPGRRRILPVKYVGGLLSMGAGLALGREGPCVQMGGNIGIWMARLTRRGAFDLRVLVASGAAAGLATAFNAPIAGGVFVLEELVKRFELRTTLATLTASGTGFIVAHVLVGNDTDFHMPPLDDPRLSQAPVVAVVGVVCGLVGVAYNHAIIAALRIADASRVPVELRAGLIGAGFGLVGWFLPDLVGAGNHLTQDALTGSGALVTVCLVLMLRAVLGVVAYAAATPGGLFAPMLVLGSYIGLAVGLAGQALVPSVTPEPAGLALIGMAAFFTASVRAPVTGLILATELTGTTNLLAPMLGACALAMLIATSLRCRPIYELLTDRAVRAARQNVAERRPLAHD